MFDSTSSPVSGQPQRPAAARLIPHPPTYRRKVQVIHEDVAGRRYCAVIHVVCCGGDSPDTLIGRACATFRDHCDPLYQHRVVSVVLHN